MKTKAWVSGYAVMQDDSFTCDGKTAQLCLYWNRSGALAKVRTSTTPDSLKVVRVEIREVKKAKAKP